MNQQRIVPREMIRNLPRRDLMRLSAADLPDHQAEWVRAVRGGKRIEYDATAGQVRNGPAAAPCVRRECRKGWTL